MCQQQDGSQGKITLQYHVLDKLGAGSFGVVYSAINPDGKEVAIKLESASKKYLEIESKIYRRVLRDVLGIPRFVWFGEVGMGKYRLNLLAMEVLGPSLADLYYTRNRKFSLKTVLLLADQLLTRFEVIHNRHYIHRDIKCENFAMGLGDKSSIVYVIDFGVSIRYEYHKPPVHAPYSAGHGMCGTARYASLNVHNGIEPDRRDDLLALGYVFLYLLRGNLPWQSVDRDKKMEKRENYRRIKRIKERTSAAELCAGFPKEFVMYFNYCSALEYGEKPDYGYLRTIFRKLCFREGYSYDNKFDWTPFEPSDPTDKVGNSCDKLGKPNTLLL